MCDTLLSIAEADICRPLLLPTIITELERNLARRGLNQKRITHRPDQMNGAFPGALPGASAPQTTPGPVGSWRAAGVLPSSRAAGAAFGEERFRPSWYPAGEGLRDQAGRVVTRSIVSSKA